MKSVASLILSILLSTSAYAEVEVYDLDIKGAHASIQFRIKHLGFSWLFGRFNKLEGWISGDQSVPSSSKVEVSIDTASIDTNHAERDKHLRSADFLNVKKYPHAKFVSTRVVDNGDKTGTIYGNLSLHGVTKEIKIDAKYVGHGADPWGGYRAGFEGTTTLKLADFGITYNLGPASTYVEMMLFIEGVRRSEKTH
ncbi:MAG: YceI family protein [Pseudomonadales bacterium]|nr:YceI family protein [Pseudomonadales bacterium]